MANTFSRRESSIIQKQVTDTLELEVDAVTVAVTADTRIGTVLYNNAGIWTTVNAANVDNAAGVLVDDNFRFFDETTPPTAGNQTLNVAVGLVVVNENNLLYAADVNTTALENSAKAALRTHNIKAVAGIN